MPSAARAARRAGSRVVPRTACPAARRLRASSLPRQPQAMIRQRATVLSLLGARRLVLGIDFLFGGRGLVVGARSLRQSSGTTPCVGQLEQLLDVAVSQIAFAARQLRRAVAGDAHLHLSRADLRFATSPPARVARGDHLIEVLGLKLLPRLGDLTGRAQADLLKAVARV